MQLPTEDEYGEFLDWKRGRIEEEDWDKDPGKALGRALDNLDPGDKEGERAVIEKYNAHMKAVRIRDGLEEEEPEPEELTPEEQEAADERFYADLDQVEPGDKEAMREVLRKHNRLGGEEV